MRSRLSEELLHLRAGLSMLNKPDVALGEAICAALRVQVEKLGLSIGAEPVWGDAHFSEAVDPFSREVSLVASWSGKLRDGKVTFFPDGRIFADYQVLLPHPQREEAFVEAVEVWGRPGELRGDVVIAEFAK